MRRAALPLAGLLLLAGATASNAAPPFCGHGIRGVWTVQAYVGGPATPWRYSDSRHRHLVQRRSGMAAASYTVVVCPAHR